MKNMLCILILGTTLSVFSQELPENLTLAVKDNQVESSSVKLNPDLHYYSKNYNKVFGHDNYTFDSLSYGERNIYVGDNTKLFYDKNTPHIFTVMPMAGVNVDACMAQPSNAGYAPVIK